MVFGRAQTPGQGAKGSRPGTKDAAHRPGTSATTKAPSTAYSSRMGTPFSLQQSNPIAPGLSGASLGAAVLERSPYTLFQDPGRLRFGPLAGQEAEAAGIFNKASQGGRGMHPCATHGMERPKSVPSLGGKFRPPEKGFGAKRFGWYDKMPFDASGRSYLGGKMLDLTMGVVMRTKQAIAHDMAWLYLRMKRDPEHPLRQAHIKLPATGVVSGLRDSGGFEFWRDLRPPFIVTKVEREYHTHPKTAPCTAISEDTFKVSYECALDYSTERAWGGAQDGGTFDNVVHAAARIEIPENWPADGSNLTILDWGQPILNWTPDMDAKANPPKKSDEDGENVDWDAFQKIKDSVDMRAGQKSFRKDVSEGGHARRSTKFSRKRRNQQRQAAAIHGSEAPSFGMTLTRDSEPGAEGLGNISTESIDVAPNLQLLQFPQLAAPGSPRGGGKANPRKASVLKLGGYGDKDDDHPVDDDHGLAELTIRREKLLAHQARQLAAKSWRRQGESEGPTVRRRRMCCSSAGHVWYDG